MSKQSYLKHIVMSNVDSTLSRECVKMPLDRGDSKILTKALLIPTLFSLVTLLRAETLSGPTLLLLFDQLSGSLEGQGKGLGWVKGTSAYAHPGLGGWRIHGDPAIIGCVRAVLVRTPL